MTPLNGEKDFLDIQCVYCEGEWLIKLQILNQGKSTLRPTKVVVTNITFSYIWFFCASADITSWIIFICLKYIGLDLNLRKSIKKNKIQQTLVNFNV